MKLVISLHFLMYRLCKGQIQPAELSDALFFPRCTREHALAPDEQDLRESPLVVAHPDVHRLAVEQMLAAESSGRIRWKALDETLGYEDLAQFLSTRGLVVPEQRVKEFRQRAYTHEGVRRFCQGLPVEVLGWSLPPAA